MTNSYASSPRPLRLILIHGMNNNLDCFYPLRDALKAQDFQVEMVVLPNHGEARAEVTTLTKALEHLNHSLAGLVRQPYVVVAFSQGAQYFQLWLKQFGLNPPQAMVLLAPAVFINYHPFLDKLFRYLPRSCFFTSRMPKIFRRYDHLFFWEYQLLFAGVTQFKLQGPLTAIPTLVAVDLKDELVNARKVLSYYQSLGAKIWQIKRENLKKGLGQHHIIFHPEYFQDQEWEEFISRIGNHLRSNAGA